MYVDLLNGDCTKRRGKTLRENRIFPEWSLVDFPRCERRSCQTRSNRASLLELEDQASPKLANSTPIVEPFINTSPSLTSPLTRLRKHCRAPRARWPASVGCAFGSRVIRPVSADRYRCPIDGMEYFLAGLRGRVSIRNFHEETISFAVLTLDRIAC